MTRLEEAIKEIGSINDAFQDWKKNAAAESENLRKSIDDKLVELHEWKTHFEDQSSSFSTLLKSTYIRWGRTTCPGNGSDLVYDGFAGGSYYSHKGAASSMLCLPKDPDWDAGKFNDKMDADVAYIYGTEYEDASGRSDRLFGDDHQNHDVPCVVCEVRKRSSVLMIPGKTKCHAGWTLEYSGYLMAGYYNHNGATDYYCVDKDPEDIPGGENNSNGRVLYFVEASCGSLRCPPYVSGREFQCSVCSK